MRRSATRENLPDMNLRHSTLQEAAKLSQRLWRVVHRVPLKDMPALDQACINTIARGEKLSDFPSLAIGSSENAEICRLSRNPEGRLTVKFRSRGPKKLLPSDLPSKMFA